MRHASTTNLTNGQTVWRTDPGVGLPASKPTDVRVVGVQLYFLPVHTRIPLKFGSETLTSVICARVSVTVEDARGRRATGWGETPLSVQWVWPSEAPYGERLKVLCDFCQRIAEHWANFNRAGHPLEIGHAFEQEVLSAQLEVACADSPAELQMPLLAGLVCCSPFDIATYDAYGKLHGRSVWQTLCREYLSFDLSHYLEPADDANVNFSGKYPADSLIVPPAEKLPAWHLVGGLDPIDQCDLKGDEPNDGYPVVLSDWIAKDGLKCLKIKLRGTDCQWDYDRLVRVGQVAKAGGVEYLTADFNCTVLNPDYVVDILDRLAASHSDIYDRILYIEQPFPYDLEANLIDVSEVAKRKPLLMDESAHNWKLVKLGRSLGWTGVALKTCKTLTGALLSLAWAKSHGMDIMVQDLTNPMLAQIPHVSLAAHIETLYGVETNAMQFYPDASAAEARVHPGIYKRNSGTIDLSTVRGPGFGYRIDEIDRQLPEPVATYGLQGAGEMPPPAPHARDSQRAKSV